MSGHVEQLGGGWTAEAIRPAPSDPWRQTEHAADPSDATGWQVRAPDGEAVGETADLDAAREWNGPEGGPLDDGEGWTLKASVGEMTPAERDAASDAYARADSEGLVPRGVEQDEFVALVHVAVHDPEADWTTDSRMQAAAKRRMDAEDAPKPEPGTTPNFTPQR